MLAISFPQWDKDLFLYLNSKHIAWLDPIMYFISTYAFCIATCLIIAAYIIFKDRLMGIRAVFFMFMGLAANFVINRIVKFFIMRPRPGSDPDLVGVVRQLEDIGTTSSFFSAHASCSIAFAVFSALYFKNKLYSLLIFIWAFAVSYSRIYVGKHYPIDIIVGIFFGILTGWLAYWVYRVYSRKKDFVR